MFKITVKVEGLKCPKCEKHVSEAIKETFSVKKVVASHTDKEVMITTKEEIMSEKLGEVIKEAGYQMVDIKTEIVKSIFG